MPKNARDVSKSGVYYIMLRGINRQTIIEDEEDMQRLFETLVKYKQISKYELYAYCIMSG